MIASPIADVPRSFSDIESHVFKQLYGGSLRFSVYETLVAVISSSQATDKKAFPYSSRNKNADAECERLRSIRRRAE